MVCSVAVSTPSLCQPQMAPVKVLTARQSFRQLVRGNSISAFYLFLLTPFLNTFVLIFFFSLLSLALPNSSSSCSLLILFLSSPFASPWVQKHPFPPLPKSTTVVNKAVSPKDKFSSRSRAPNITESYSLPLVLAPCPVGSVLRTLNCSNNTLTVSWMPVLRQVCKMCPVIYYSVNYNVTALATDGTILRCTTQSSSCTITNLQCGQQYNVSVKAISSTCEGFIDAWEIVNSGKFVGWPNRAVCHM